MCVGEGGYLGSKCQTNTLKLLRAENEENQYERKGKNMCTKKCYCMEYVAGCFYHTLLILLAKKVE